MVGDKPRTEDKESTYTYVLLTFSLFYIVQDPNPGNVSTHLTMWAIKTILIDLSKEQCGLYIPSLRHSLC